MDLSWLERVRSNDKCCTKLRLSNKRISASMATELAEAMKTNGTVTSIELTDNQIGDDGCSKLASVIPLSSSLQALEVANNQIAGPGAAALAKALQESESLEELDLSRNEIGVQGIQSLADALPKISCLVKLELAETNLGDDGLAVLVRGLQQNRSVTWLGLRGNHIGPNGALALSNEILLGHPHHQLSPSSSNTIKSLNFRQNQLGDQGVLCLMNALKSNHTISELDLTCNQVGPLGAQAIAEVLTLPNTSLKLLFLGENQLGDDGMETISMALKENTSVTYLDLQTNDISFIGAEALDDTFRLNRTLTHVILDGNDPGVVPPPEPLQRNRVLRHHGQSLLEHGPGLFVQVVEHPKSGPFLEWTEEFWKGTRLDEPIEWELIHRVLQVLRHATGNIKTPSNGNLPPWPLPTGNLLACCKQQPSALVDLIDRSTNAKGSNLLHVAISAQSPLALDLCKFLVSDLGANIDRVKDAQGRSAREIGVLHSGSERIQEWARCVGYFLHRYQVEGGSLQSATPVYRTEKGMAHFARDAWKSRSDPMAEVMLFFVDDPDQFTNEISCRLKIKPEIIPSGVDIPDKAQRFSDDFVVPLIRFHDELDETGARHKCLVFPLLERSLQGMIDLERVACGEIEQIQSIVSGISKAVQHAHLADPEYPMIHCNIEPRNIIRANGSYKLMGFDMAVQVGEPITVKRAITNACPPEQARFLIQLESLDDLTDKLSDLKRQQMQLGQSSPGESKRLLEILKEVQLLRKKIAILELKENANTKQRQLQSATVGGLIFQESEQKEIELLLPSSWNKQIPGEESGQGSALDVVGVKKGAVVSTDDTMSITLDDEPSAVALPVSPLSVHSDGIKPTKNLPTLAIAVQTGSNDRALHLIAHPTLDLWSLGVTLYKLFTGEDLFHTNHDGHIASIKDQVDLSLWEGLTSEQLDKVLSRCEDATTIQRNRAKDLVLRCLHPDPSKRPQNVGEVLSHSFLSCDDSEGESDLLVSTLNFSLGIDETSAAVKPISFLILPCKLFVSELTGKLVAPAQAKDAIDKFCKMQEFAVLQHLLSAKYRDNDLETEQLIKDCRNLEGKEATEKLLKFIQVSETSVEYFIERIHDLNEFKKTPSTCMEKKSKEAFNDWWQALSGRPAYFYLVDEFFLKPVVTIKYPIEIQPKSTLLRDLIPLLCLRKTQVPILSACAFVLGRPISLPSRLNEWAVEELKKLNDGASISDYLLQRQTVHKLKDFEVVDDGKERVSSEGLASVEDALSSILQDFYSKQDPEREFAGLRRVTDRDGSSRWTSELGCAEMELAKAIPVTENISRRRQLEVALHEAQETLQRVGSTAKRLVEERDGLQKEKLQLIRSNQGLEAFIEKEMLADASAGCCVIL